MGTRTPSPPGAGLGATSSPGRRVPWAHSQAPGDGAGLTCVPSPQTTRCRISPGWASRLRSCCSSGSCSARLGTTAKEPETRPGAEHRDPAPPTVWSPGRELPARKLLEEPLTWGEMYAGREEARESLVGGVGGALEARLTGAPSLPPREDAPTPVSAHTPPPPHPSGSRRIPVPGAGPRPARPQALSTQGRLSFIVNASHLWCAQRPPSLRSETD